MTQVHITYLLAKDGRGKGDMTQSVIASECAQCCVEATQICANLLKNGEQATKWEEQFILACVHKEFDKAFALLSEKKC